MIQVVPLQLVVTCDHCKRQATFRASNKTRALSRAGFEGWMVNTVSGKALCPQHRVKRQQRVARQHTPTQCACGKEPTVEHTGLAVSLPEEEYDKRYVSCSSCGERGPKANTAIQAIEAWNRQRRGEEKGKG